MRYLVKITSQLGPQLGSLAQMKLTFQSCHGDSTMEQILAVYMVGSDLSSALQNCNRLNTV